MDCTPSPPALELMRSSSSPSRKRSREEVEDEEERDELESPVQEVDMADVNVGTSTSRQATPILASPSQVVSITTHKDLDLPSPSKRIKIDVKVVVPSAAGLIASAVAGSMLTFAGLAYL